MILLNIIFLLFFSRFPCASLSLSPLDRNYLVAKHKDRPLEFWDAKNLTFMRELVSNPPTFSCVVSPSAPQPATHTHTDQPWQYTSTSYTHMYIRSHSCHMKHQLGGNFRGRKFPNCCSEMRAFVGGLYSCTNRPPPTALKHSLK